jgi:hypothetical protein
VAQAIYTIYDTGWRRLAGDVVSLNEKVGLVVVVQRIIVLSIKLQTNAQR